MPVAAGRGGGAAGDKPLLPLSPPVHFPGHRPSRPSPPLPSDPERRAPTHSHCCCRHRCREDDRRGSYRRSLADCGGSCRGCGISRLRRRRGGTAAAAVSGGAVAPPPHRPPVGGGGTAVSPPPKSNPQTAALPPPQPQPPRHMLPPPQRNRLSTPPASATATATHPMEEPRAIA